MAHLCLASSSSSADLARRCPVPCWSSPQEPSPVRAFCRGTPQPSLASSAWWSATRSVIHSATTPANTFWSGSATARNGCKPRNPFVKWGPLSIFFSRFLVTAIALPVNLMSGTTRFPFKKFFLYDALGEIVWIFGYGGLGYLFGSQWEVVNEFLGNFGGLTLGVLIFVVGIKQIWNWQQKRQQLSS
jgi:hypothetical protein